MEEYYVPTGDAAAEFTERRSRFIGRIWRTETEEEAIAHIRAMREKHWDATHNVYAYVIRDGAMRYSDDGEPQGTAGMPVLEVLCREELFNVCCVVTRYFGGILLGAGGLVRAYAKSAKMAVDAAGISVKRVWERVALQCPYALFARVKQEMARYEGKLAATEYGADIQLTLLLPQTKTQEFLERIVDVSGGKLHGIIIGQEYQAFPCEL